MRYQAKSVVFVVCFFFIVTLKAQEKNAGYKKLFAEAENLVNDPNPSKEKDDKAVEYYKQVINYLKKNNNDNEFLFNVYISAGSLHQILGDQKVALQNFCAAISLKKYLPNLPDSVLFRPFVYAGNAYYSIDKPADAEYYYRKAEIVANKYPTVSELERLYNTLGVISYTMGNYAKSINYYQKALSTLKKKPRFDNSFLITYQNNLASSYKKQNNFNSALSVYKSLLPYHIETDKLYHNIASVYLAKNKADSALLYLNKVGYNDQKKLNDYGVAYIKKRDFSKALFFLKKAIALNSKQNKNTPNSNFAITLKYIGDIFTAQKQPLKALSYYQKALQNFKPDFTSNLIFENPSSFLNAYNGLEMLENLSAKAKAFHLYFNQTNKPKFLFGALQTYLTYYKLAGHIERIYESDEARLLINNLKNKEHQKPIEICLQLYSITKQEKYKRLAFDLDEQNKANTLALYIEETKLKKQSGVPSKLLAEELSLKKVITQLTLKASAEDDKNELNKLQTLLQEHNISLISVQDKINKQPGYRKLKLLKKSINLTDLQKLIPENGAVLSYHIGEKNLICFVITNTNFNCIKTSINEGFQKKIFTFYRLAQQREGNNKIALNSLSALLYNQLIKPTEELIKDKKRLVIIPDDELNYLPFELLIDSKKQTLLSNFTIAYNYSCALLEDTQNNKNIEASKNLGMAPFYKIIPSGLSNLQTLPSSREEIQKVKGVTILGKRASKSTFLKEYDRYQIIHLATHAVADDANPAQSYIAFYPDKDMAKWQLFVPEIYNLQLQNLQLLLLSACESGTGNLVKGEGLMSLARAFSYAGCKSMITSVWKADDVSTAYITSKFYIYFNNGNTVAEALQKAKLSYLNDENIAGRKKLSGYYSHLKFIGGFEESKSLTNINLIWACALAIFAVSGLSIFRFLRKRNSI